MRRVFLFCSFLISVISCHRINPDLDLSPRLEGGDSTAVASAMMKDLSFFQSWSEDPLYTGIVAELAGSAQEDAGDIYQYAERQYSKYSKEKRYRFHQDSLLYVLYCDNGEVVVQTSGLTRKIIDGMCPGELYKLTGETYPNPVDAIDACARLRDKAVRQFKGLSRFRKVGISTPLLETLDLRPDELFYPSDSFWFKSVFSLPYGGAMVGLLLFRSIYVTAVFFLLLFVMCNMACFRRISRGKQLDHIAALYWCFSLFAFLSFLCLMNSIDPSPEIRYGMTHYGFKDVFDTCYQPFYASRKMPLPSVFSIILLTVLFVINLAVTLIKSGGSDGDLGKVILVSAGGSMCRGGLIYAAIAYLFFCIIKDIYLLSFPEEAKRVGHRPVYLFGGIVLTLYLLIPLAYDSVPGYFPYSNSLIVIWSVLAISGAFLLCLDIFDSDEYGFRPWQVFLFAYNDQTMSEKWGTKMSSFYFQNFLFTAGITFPVYLIICVLKALFPFFGTVLLFMLFVFPMGLGIVFLITQFGNLIHGRGSLIIKEEWALLYGNTEGLSEKQIIKRLTIARMESIVGPLGVFALVIWIPVLGSLLS